MDSCIVTSIQNIMLIGKESLISKVSHMSDDIVVPFDSRWFKLLEGEFLFSLMEECGEEQMSSRH